MAESQVKKSKEKGSVPMRERRLDYRIYSPMSLATMTRVAYKTKLSGTAQHSKVQVKALLAYSHSIAEVVHCCGMRPYGARLFILVMLRSNHSRITGRFGARRDG